MLKEIIKKRKLVITLILLVFFFFFFSIPLLSAQDRKLEIKYPEIFKLRLEGIETNLAVYVKYLFNFSVLIIGLVLLTALIGGGILYLTSAGNPIKIKEAKDQIASAFLGAILLLSGYLILTTINPELVIFNIPPLSEPNLCENDNDCPRGFECQEENNIKKCVIKKSCQNDQDCPYTYKCEENLCIKEKEEITEIYYEIPLGQLVEKGLWEKGMTNNLTARITNFNQFLNQEIETDGQTFNRISDLNKYLKKLTESCHCEELDGICQKPKNYSFPAGCIGDPCKKVRTKINDILKKNKEISGQLLVYKENLTEVKNRFEEEGRKFRQITTEYLEECKRKELLNRREYYDTVDLIEEQGGKTELIKSYLPAKDDPLVFYCPVGGTIFDYPYRPEKFTFEELEIIRETTPEPEAVSAPEPSSCPIIIPFGQDIFDKITGLSYETNSNLEDLIYYIDKILAELTKMTELVSQCNESRCKIDCSCIRNPCYEPACGIPPGRTPKCGIGRCTPPTPFTPNFCYFFCDSPCLQAVGGCHGEPCPRQKITETSERIKIYEEEILVLLDEITGGIKDAQLLLKNEKKDEIDLETIREGIIDCFSMGPKIAREEPEEQPFWTLSRCEMTIGEKGIDNKIINYCHPQDLFCCASEAISPLEIARFPSLLRKDRPVLYTPLPKNPQPPSAYGFNKVPYFSQCDRIWRNYNFGYGKTLCQAGDGPSSIAMALNFFNQKVDPISTADWILENDYRIPGAGIKTNTCCQAIAALGKGNLKCQDHKEDIKTILNELRGNNKKVAIINTRGAPPYNKGGHYIVLTGIEKEWDQEFVNYNDPTYDPLRPKRRPGQGKIGKKPIDWFELQGISTGCIISE